MTPRLSRRHMLGSTLAAGLAASRPLAARADAPGAAGAPRRLVAESRILTVNGRAAKVLGLAQADGTPGLRLAPGERFTVSLENHLTEPTIVHWHGQLPPWRQDGFPWPETPPLAPGAAASYDFAPIPGSFWMHSHQGMQEQRLLAAPLIVRSAAEEPEDRQEIVLMLHDFSFRPPAEILADLVRRPPAGGMASGMAPGMPGMPSMPSMSAPTPNPAPPPQGMRMAAGMDLNDVHYDAFLANDRTLADPAVVRVAPKGRLRLRAINGASSSAFWLDLGGLPAQVVAVDGHPVRPLAVSGPLPLAIAQRLDLLIDLPGAGAFPILAQLEGARSRTGILLASPGATVSRPAPMAARPAPPVDNRLEVLLAAAAPLAPRPPDLRATILLDGSMQPYRWTLNGATWPEVPPLMLRAGSRVQLDLVNRSAMAHPMHLHGHAFQVLAIDGRPVAGAVRDTVLVGPAGRVRIAFDADNPGRWAFHCHNLYHMMTGMMMEFRYHGIPS
ncbi:multicopper oxidase family protein [Acidisoma sp. C75]